MCWEYIGIVIASRSDNSQAEQWLLKALASYRQLGSRENESGVLYHLAALIKDQPERIDECRSLAETALEIRKKFDPFRGQIWLIYKLLSEIADLQGKPEEARKFSDAEQKTRSVIQLGPKSGN